MIVAARILILCTGNSARSQMAEGILRLLDRRIEVHSAGTVPARQVNPSAIQVMQEIGVDISRARPKTVNEFLEQPFDYVITVCSEADRACPVFSGPVKHRLHIGFEDPTLASGTQPEVLAVFRKVRDEIQVRFSQFYCDNLKDASRGRRKKG